MYALYSLYSTYIMFFLEVYTRQHAHNPSQPHPNQPHQPNLPPPQPQPQPTPPPPRTPREPQRRRRRPLRPRPKPSTDIRRQNLRARPDHDIAPPSRQTHFRPADRHRTARRQRLRADHVLRLSVRRNGLRTDSDGGRCRRGRDYGRGQNGCAGRVDQCRLGAGGLQG